jgi:protein disulfide-isomerase A1
MKLLFALALFAFLAIAFASEASDVITLDDSNFETEVAKHEFVLVEFYAPWCGHCKALAPEYESAATSLKGVAALAKVDCDTNKATGEKYKIQGFPTLKLFRNGKEFKDYDGGRKAPQIVEWMNKKVGPVAKTLKADEVEAFVKASAGKAVVGFFEEGSAKSKEFLSALTSDKAFEDFPAAQVFGGQNKVVLYRAFDGPLDFTGDLAGLKDFLVGNGYPLVEEIGSQNFQRFVDSGLPLAVAFFDVAKTEETAAALKTVTEAATALKGKMSFAWSNGVEYKEQLDSMGGDSSKLPAIAAMNIEKRLNYPYSGEFAAESLTKWAQGVVDGSVKPFLKSDPVPETQEGPVYVLVGKAFESVVEDDSKDVLVEFYAPWCGHCKTLAPKYDKLANFYKDVKNLVIAKIDATTNDTPIQIEGFPTIFFFPKGNKKNPIQYDGARNEKGFVEFLKKNAVAVKDEIANMNWEKKAAKEESKDEL